MEVFFIQMSHIHHFWHLPLLLKSHMNSTTPDMVCSQLINFFHVSPKYLINMHQFISHFLYQDSAWHSIEIQTLEFSWKFESFHQDAFCQVWDSYYYDMIAQYILDYYSKIFVIRLCSKKRFYLLLPWMVFLWTLWNRLMKCPLFRKNKECGELIHMK